jgi:hypothetical protein
MNKIKSFDILLNEHASEANPHRIGIIIGIDEKYVNCICIYKSKIDKYKFYKNDVLNDDSFKVIGHSDIIKYINNELDVYKKLV